MESIMFKTNQKGETQETVSLYSDWACKSKDVVLNGGFNRIFGTG
jgi:hypothetical protein